MRINSGLFLAASSRSENSILEMQNRIQGISPMSGCSQEVMGQVNVIKEEFRREIEIVENLASAASRIREIDLSDLLEQGARAGTSHLLERGSGLLGEAGSAATSYASSYLREKIGLASAAFSIIENSRDSIIAGAMSLIFIRIESRMEIMGDVVQELLQAMGDVDNGVTVVQDAFDIVAEGIPDQTLLDAARIIRSAERRLGIIYANLENDLGMSRSDVVSVSGHVTSAIKELSQGEDLLSRIVGSSLAFQITNDPATLIEEGNPWDRIKNGISSEWQKIEKAISSAKKIPGLLKRCATAYEDAILWVNYAKMLPDTVTFTITSRAKASLSLEVEALREMLLSQAQKLEEEGAGPKERSSSILQLNLIKIRLLYLEPFSTAETNQGQNTWYQEVQDIVNDDFWREPGERTLSEMELWVSLIHNSGSNRDGINRASGWTSSARAKIGALSSKVNRIKEDVSSINSQLMGATEGPWKVMEGYLTQFGVKNAILFLITGQLPERVESLMGTFQATRSYLGTIRNQRPGIIQCLQGGWPDLPAGLSDRATMAFVDQERERSIESYSIDQAILDSLEQKKGASYAMDTVASGLEKQT